ncbi:MAG: ankyrin repeat domain-containing protein [Alphaproteobacteria bacterium]|jgi:ankyrin repeat protein|nr:ankyrin repeat domain-containing protein [Alphaproteobacteria bacterium]
MSVSDAVEKAIASGDVEALAVALGPDFPNVEWPAGGGDPLLEYAIYHGPLSLVHALLERDADANYESPAGFPSLIAALSGARADRLAVVSLLLDFGADIGQRGVNDYTPLHWAAATDDVQAIALLLARGADPQARTRIDECATPAEEAALLGKRDAVAALTG